MPTRYETKAAANTSVVAYMAVRTTASGIPTMVTARSATTIGARISTSAPTKIDENARAPSVSATRPDQAGTKASAARLKSDSDTNRPSHRTGHVNHRPPRSV